MQYILAHHNSEHEITKSFSAKLNDVTQWHV